MRKYKNVLMAFLFFLFIVVFNLLFIPNNLDTIWNYGFSYAIRLGEIPYKDFNMVITPLYSFIMCIPLLLSNCYFSFIIFHSIIVTIEYILLYKLLDRKVYLLLLISLMFFPLVYPNYNSFLLFLMVLIVFLEEKKFKHKDIVVGFLIACSVLTKQSVGVFFILPTIIFYKKNHINLIERVFGFLIPNVIFLLYLLITGSLFNFLNLCLFGLFDFTSNSDGFSSIVILFLIIVIISLYILFKNKNNICNYYIILSYILFIPLFDNLHLFYVLFSFCFLLLNNIKISLKFNLLFYVCLIFVLFVFDKNMDVLHYKKNNLSHFEYRNISLVNVRYSEKIIQYIKNNDAILYNDDAYFYRISANQRIGHLDLVNYGNHGYNGSERIINLIKENSDKVFLVKNDCGRRIHNKETQLDPNGYNYIVKNSKKIGTICDYNLYSFEN